MRVLAVFLLGMGIAVTPAVAQHKHQHKHKHRQVGAHEHGRGTLNIAVEGMRVSIELEVPGADIVGFEHAAKTREQKAAVEKAKTQLSAAQSLFKLPASAGCRVTEAQVDIADDDDAAKEPAKSGKSAKARKASDEHDEHSEFRGQYALECAAPNNITSVEFDYFRTFARAQKLEVNLITPKGQSKFEVTREKPRIDLAGMM